MPSHGEKPRSYQEIEVVVRAWCHGERKLPPAVHDTLTPSQRSAGVAIESLRTGDIGLLIGLQLVWFEKNAGAGSNRDHRDRCAYGFDGIRRWLANRTGHYGQRSHAGTERRGRRPQSGNTRG